MAGVKDNPTVSVIIPTYNRAHFLGETIQSVLDQIYKDFEIIIVDDGSTDNTEELVKGFGNKRISYVKLEKNSGYSAVPRNTGLKAARGEYIALLDSDDVWLPNKLGLEVEFLNTHPSVGLVYSNYTYFGSRASSERSGFEEYSIWVSSKRSGVEGVSPPSGQALKELFWENPMISSAVLLRKACFEKVGLFDESLVHAGDLDMWLRIAACFEIDYIDIPLARYRWHDRMRHLETHGCLTWQIAFRRKCLEANPFLLDEIDFETMYEVYYNPCRMEGIRYLRGDDLRKAREMFRQCLRVHPRDSAVRISWLITFLPPRLVSWILTCNRWLAPFLPPRMVSWISTFKQKLGVYI